MKKEQIPMVLYFYLHSRIRELALKEVNSDGIMSINETRWRMASWKIPNPLKPIVIKIWEDLGIIKKIDKRNIQFLQTDFDMENLGKIYSELGIFTEE